MGPYHEAFNRVSFLNPLMPNPAAGGRLGALEFAGYGSGTCNCGNIPINTHYLNLGPRAGLAYRLDNKTVLRAGYGIVYAHSGALSNNGLGGTPGQVGYNASASFSSVTTGQPAFYWDGGVPAYQQPPFINPGYGAGFTTTSPSSAVAMNYVPWKIAGKPPYFENWNIGIQRSITPDMNVGVAYSASGSHFVLGNGAQGIYTNSIPVMADLALGSLLGAQATLANLAAAQAIVPGIGLPFSNFQGTIGTGAEAVSAILRRDLLLGQWAERLLSISSSLLWNADSRMASR